MKAVLLLVTLASVRAFNVAIPKHTVSNAVIPRDLSYVASPSPLIAGKPFIRTRSLRMADEAASEEKMANKITGRKKRVIWGNRIASVLFLAYAPSMVKSAIKQLGGDVFSGLYYGAGPALAGGIAFILAGAAANDRLSSDTYKRLNLFLAKYGFLNLVVVYLASLNPREYPLFVASSVIALINSIKGYGYGVKGWSLKNGDPIGDLVSMVSSSVSQLLKPPKNIKAAGYQALALTLASVKLMKLSEIVKLLMGGDRILAGVRILQYSRLMLMTVVSLTLKDAADRDRMEGTTFIELNFMNSAVLATMAAYLCKGGEITMFGGAMGFFSLFLAFNGASSILKKKSEE